MYIYIYIVLYSKKGRPWRGRWAYISDRCIYIYIYIYMCVHMDMGSFRGGYHQKPWRVSPRWGADSPSRRVNGPPSVVRSGVPCKEILKQWGLCMVNSYRDKLCVKYGLGQLIQLSDVQLYFNCDDKMYQLQIYSIWWLFEAIFWSTKHLQPVSMGEISSESGWKWVKKRSQVTHWIVKDFFSLKFQVSTLILPGVAYPFTWLIDLLNSRSHHCSASKPWWFQRIWKQFTGFMIYLESLQTRKHLKFKTYWGTPMPKKKKCYWYTFFPGLNLFPGFFHIFDAFFLVDQLISHYLSLGFDGEPQGKWLGMLRTRDPTGTEAL